MSIDFLKLLIEDQPFNVLENGKKGHYPLMTLSFLLNKKQKFFHKEDPKFVQFTDGLLDSTYVINALHQFMKTNVKFELKYHEPQIVENEIEIIIALDFDADIQKIKALETFFRNKILQFYENVAYAHSEMSIFEASVWLYGLPKHQLNYSLINFIIPPNFDASRIYKLISTPALYLQKTENLTHSALSFLKIPHLNKLIVLDGGESNPIIKIIQKYVQSKDLLACQDELIENGYEVHAKL